MDPEIVVKAEALLQAALQAGTEIRARAAEIEQARRLPADLARTLARAGLFRGALPRSLGGFEAPPALLMEVIEAVAQADGSTGWCVMIGSTSAITAAYLPAEAAAEVYGADAAVITGGVFAPLGRAVQVVGGYRVSGRWQWASGAQNCAWLMGGCTVTIDGQPVLLPGGMPDSRMMFFPAAEVTLHDTWYVAGLCGTGSLDMEVRDLFVPAERSVSLISDRPRLGGPLYAFPVFGMLALGIGAVTLGIARAAIEELVALARVKTPQGNRRPLAQRPQIQSQLAEAEAQLRAARAFYFGAIAEAWEEAQTCSQVSVPRRATLRLAASHATQSAARVVDLMYNAAGGTAVFQRSPLQRHFRDVHVATQHVMVAPQTFEMVGRLLLGLETDTALL